MSVNVLGAVISKTPRCLLMISRTRCQRAGTSAACAVHSQRCRTAVTPQTRQCSSAAISPPQMEGEEREYAPNIQQLVSDISKLTLVEVADLNDLLKKTLKITDTPMMAMGAMPAAQAEEEVAQVKEEQVIFTVKLTKFDAAKKVALIKEIKAQMEGMNLVQSKKFVESLPQSVKKDISKEDAEKLKTALEAAGGTAEIE